MTDKHRKQLDGKYIKVDYYRERIDCYNKNGHKLDEVGVEPKQYQDIIKIEINQMEYLLKAKKSQRIHYFIKKEIKKVRK